MAESVGEAKAMQDLTQRIKDELLCHGADLVGFGDLTELPENIRCGLPVGIGVAVKYSKEVIKGIVNLPTMAYYDEYNSLNNKLDMLVNLGADYLKALGYQAVAQSMDYVHQSEVDCTTKLPHKTVATRAGLGWIGKSALLVTKEYGPMVRISSILTDAPLKTARPVNTSKCGNCEICKKACPAGAISGRLWSVDLYRDEFFDAKLCRTTARQRAMQGFGIEITQCGRCIYVCPYTQRLLQDEGCQ